MLKSSKQIGSGIIKAATLGAAPVRHLNIHEYQAMELFQKAGVHIPKNKVAASPAQAEAAAEELKGPDFVVKAQVLAGGRGKGKWKNNNFQGGVHACNSALEARSLAAKMINNNLVTKQTGSDGRPCHKVLITERLYLRKETYFAILMDRQTAGPVMIASTAGGMNIEDVARDTPELIFKEAIDITKGVQPEQLERLASCLKFDKKVRHLAIENMQRLYDLFIKNDCTLVEINPMAETHDGRVICLDGKVNFDDNAEYRQKGIFDLRDTTQEDPNEVEAQKIGLNYIRLDGDIGCLVNGAGLAMATMDAIKFAGGNPANFLDLGGGATKEMVTAAFRLLGNDPSVKAILVNIFGGIMRCDIIALGMIAALSELGIKKPIVVRLAGTNVDAAKTLIEESGLRMLTADDLGQAADKVVRVVEIVEMAKKAKLDVSFEIPI